MRKDLPASSAPCARCFASGDLQREAQGVEFETDDEEEDDASDDEDRPKISLGEEITLDDDDDKASVSTEDELLQKAGESDVVALNL
jgi:hypothetical protein